VRLVGAGDLERAAILQAGGASRDRTGDLLVANQTLSQLSYGPLSDGQKSPAALLARRLKGATFRRLAIKRPGASGGSVRRATLA
jgi:hypothetical protein